MWGVMNTKAFCAALLATTLLTGAAPSAAETKSTAHPALWPAAKSQGLVDPQTEAFVDSLLAKLTLEEKVGQMIQGDIASVKPEDLKTYPLGSILAGGSSPPLGAPDRSPIGPWVKSVEAFRAAAAQRQGGTQIPLMFGIDSVHGNGNAVGATLFPHNSALGATRDPELIRRIGAATAQETAAAGFDWAFGPTLTVPRDDRWGRTYEGYSEDPEIVRGYAGQMILGLQGAVSQGGVIQQGHVAASAKHFLGDGGTHGGKDQGDTQVSEAELIRLHAQGYVPAINAGTMTIMASFNSWNGEKMHGNKSLLTDVLKGKMGFDGFVVGDWNGHGQVAGCTPKNCPQAANAGLDMYMAPDSWKDLYANTLAQAKSGEIPMARIDDAVRRILRVKAKLGLFQQAGRWRAGGVMASAEHRAIARQAVRESLVLLKNNGVLPVKASANILVAGSGADDIGQQAGGWTLSWQGTGNTKADFPNAQSIYSGLKETVEASGGSGDAQRRRRVRQEARRRHRGVRRDALRRGRGRHQDAGIPAREQDRPGPAEEAEGRRRAGGGRVPVGPPAVGEPRDQRLGRLRRRLAAGLGRRRDRRRADRRQGRQAAHRLPRQAVVQLAQDRRPVHAEPRRQEL
jgi:beta-glucosidase